MLGPGHLVPGPGSKDSLALSEHVFLTLWIPGPHAGVRWGLRQSWIFQSSEPGWAPLSWSKRIQSSLPRLQALSGWFSEQIDRPVVRLSDKDVEQFLSHIASKSRRLKSEPLIVILLSVLNYHLLLSMS